MEAKAKAKEVEEQPKKPQGFQKGFLSGAPAKPANGAQPSLTLSAAVLDVLPCEIARDSMCTRVLPCRQHCQGCQGGKQGAGWHD